MPSLVAATLQRSSFTVHLLVPGSERALCGRAKRPISGGGRWWPSAREASCRGCLHAAGSGR